MPTGWGIKHFFLPQNYYLVSANTNLANHEEAPNPGTDQKKNDVEGDIRYSLPGCARHRRPLQPELEVVPSVVCDDLKFRAYFRSWTRRLAVCSVAVRGSQQMTIRSWRTSDLPWFLSSRALLRAISNAYLISALLNPINITCCYAMPIL